MLLVFKTQLELSTIIAMISAKLIIHARHEWPVNEPKDYHPWKDENLCLSVLGLVHKSRN